MRGQAFSGDLIDFVGDGVPGGNQGGGDAVQNCLIIVCVLLVVGVFIFGMVFFAQKAVNEVGRFCFQRDK